MSRQVAATLFRSGVTRLAAHHSLTLRAAPVARQLAIPITSANPLVLHRRPFSTTGRSPADLLSDELAEANLLLNDLLDDDDRESDDFRSDLAEVQKAYVAVCDAYDSAMVALSEKEQASLRKNFDLAVVGFRDKLVALEEEAGV
jgi:hypothetical protein